MMATKSTDQKPTPEAQLRSFLAKLDQKNQKLFGSIRAAVRKRLPTANELAYDYSDSIVVGYSPSEHGIQSIVAIAARTDGARLYFNQGPKLADPKRLLQGSAKQARYIPLESAKRLAHPDVKALIDDAVDHSDIPLPSKGKGALIIKSDGTKRVARAKAKRKKK